MRLEVAFSPLFELIESTTFEAQAVRLRWWTGRRYAEQTIMPKAQLYECMKLNGTGAFVDDL